MVDINGALIVTTFSGAVYRLGPTDPDGLRNVSKDQKKLPFERAQVIGSGFASFMGGDITDPGEIVVDKALILRPEGNKVSDLDWFTSPIIKVEPA
jgi:hypothetical protein